MNGTRPAGPISRQALDAKKVTAAASANAESIRAAQPEDAPAIEAIVRRAYAKYSERMDREPAPMTADYAELIARGGVWALDLDGVLAGTIILHTADDHLLVSNVAVSPEFQGRRLGVRLLDFAEREARRQAFAEMRLYTNEKMHESLVIYDRLGWERYAEGEQDGFRRVFMRKAVGA
jgi:GNAT superfamily N-acetyltransferase